MTHKWAWPRSRDPISKFWDPLITFERIKLPALNLVNKVNFGTPYNFGTNRAIELWVVGLVELDSSIRLGGS